MFLSFTITPCCSQGIGCKLIQILSWLFFYLFLHKNCYRFPLYCTTPPRQNTKSMLLHWYYLHSLYRPLNLRVAAKLRMLLFAHARIGNGPSFFPSHGDINKSWCAANTTSEWSLVSKVGSTPAAGSPSQAKSLLPSSYPLIVESSGPICGALVRNMFDSLWFYTPTPQRRPLWRKGAVRLGVTRAATCAPINCHSFLYHHTATMQCD